MSSVTPFAEYLNGFLKTITKFIHLRGASWWAKAAPFGHYSYHLTLAVSVSMKILKYIVGFLLIFLYHLPKFILKGLMISYNSVFKANNNLTADPRVHLRRAEKLIQKNKNSLLLYAALEIRFAIERMIDHQVSLSDKATKKLLKKYDPVKKKSAMTAIDPSSNKRHSIYYYIDKETGEKIYWGNYTPIDEKKLSEIKGKLGDLLHSKVALNLGISNDPWYIETRRFLKDSINYLKPLLKDNESYFLYADTDNFELIEDVSTNS